MIRIGLLSASIVGAIVMLSGCVSSGTNEVTTKYVKANNLTNEDYKESEIMCISDKLLTMEERGKIFELVSVRFHADFSTNRCKRSFQLHYTPSEPQNYTMYKSIMKQCLDDVYFSIAESERSHFIRHSDSAYKIEFRHYLGANNVFTSGKKNKLFGYLGFEDKDNKTIVYVSDTTQDDHTANSEIGYIREGVLNYMKRNPTKCKALGSKYTSQKEN